MSEFTSAAFSNGSDITSVAEQEGVKDSLLSDETRNLGTISELFARTEAAMTKDKNGLYADDYPPGHQPEAEQVEEEEQADPYEMANVASREELEKLGLLEEQEPEQGDDQERAQQAEQRTPEEAIENYQESIERMELKSEESAEIVSGLAQDMGLNASDPGKLENLLMVTAMSAALHGAQPIQPQTAQAWAAQLYPGIGLDTRFAGELLPAQAVYMAESTHSAFANIEDTCQQLEAQGVPLTVENVNQDRNGSLLFFRGFISGVVGQEVGQVIHDGAGRLVYVTTGSPQLDQLALRVGDRITSLYLNMRQRADEAHERAERRESRQARSSQFQTNQAIFDDEAMEIYQQREGRL